MPAFANLSAHHRQVGTRRSSLTLHLLCLVLVATVATADPLGITTRVLDAVTAEYGRRARGRILAWQHLVKSSSHQTEQEKLKRVNDFFNQVRFVSDQSHWQKVDYWATPIELLASHGGDCEDFAIAKYITLRALEIPDQKLRITYVKALELNQAHMVLTFYDTPSSIPQVLDNLIPEIKPANLRPDLEPVYSFNGGGLWLTNKGGEDQKLGSATELNMWRDLVARLNKERNS